MTHLPKIREGRTRASIARRPFRMSTFDGEPVVMVPLSDTTEAMVSPETWFSFLTLGFSANLSADSDGKGRTYARHMVTDPRPNLGRSRAETLARTVVAIGLVKAEAEGGHPAPAKGWVVRHANGNRLDNRDSNLLCVPANGCRNSFRAVWNVRERVRLVAEGLDPNRVFAERRRKAGRKLHGALSRADTRVAEPAISPLGATRVATQHGEQNIGGAH